MMSELLLDISAAPPQHQTSQSYGSPMNRYRIVERLSAGSFGVVFKAIRNSDQRILVLKRVPLANLDDHQKYVAIHEVELMQQLHHPHIVQHRDAFLFNQEDLCIVMDYYGGGDLSQIIRDAQEALSLSQENAELQMDAIVPPPRSPVPAPLSKRRSQQNPPEPLKSQQQQLQSPRLQYLPESRIMLWFVEMSLALHYLHSHRIVHRDIKTQNVFVNSANGEVAVGDFGVARIAETIAHAHAAAPTATGTPLYMAPEVHHGGHATFKSDVWSLGCILYEMLALQHPFASSDLSGLIIRITKGTYAPLPKHFSKPLLKLVDRMLERDPKKRPLIDEVLMMPFVKAYLKTYLSVRVPLESYDSLSEQMLRKQLEALGINSTVETENTEEVLSFVQPAGFSSRASSQGRRSSSGDPPLRSGVVSSYAAPLEELNSPSSKYEAIHRSRVVEAYAASPEVSSPPTARRWNSHQRSESNPNAPRIELSDEPASSGAVPVRRSTSLEAPGSRRTHASMLPQAVGNANVDDMRGKTLCEIEQEVARYRRLVQQELSPQTSLLDPPQLSQQGPSRVSRRSFQSNNGSSYFNQSSESPLLPPQGMQTPGASFGQDEGQRSRGHHFPAGAAVAPPSGAGGGSQFYRALSQQRQVIVTDAAVVVSSKPNELSRMQRRKQLHQQCVDALGEKVFHEVYGYYNGVPPAYRDTEVVRHIVPERTLWTVLPLVEEVLNLDREIMRV